MTEEILWCDNGDCDKPATFMIFPNQGHPSDGAASCDEDLLLNLIAASSTPDQVTSYEVRVVR